MLLLGFVLLRLETRLSLVKLLLKHLLVTRELSTKRERERERGERKLDGYSITGLGLEMTVLAVQLDFDTFSHKEKGVEKHRYMGWVNGFGTRLC